MNTELVHNHKPAANLDKLFKGCPACAKIIGREVNITGIYKGVSKSKAPDMVNHPPHYTSHPSGVECIQVTEHMSFCVGNAMKYLWRADEKGSALEDLEKARWYITREIERRKGMKKSS